MNPGSTQVIRPAGAGHETLYVLLLCLIILAVAGTVVSLHGEPQAVEAVASHQLDAPPRPERGRARHLCRPAGDPG
jgi:cytochrome b561